MTDEDRFTALFEEHYEAVLRYAWRRVGPIEAPDIAAETFRVAWEKYDRFPDEHPLPWLYTTARNLVANQTRRGRRRPWLDLTEPEIAEDLTSRLAAVEALRQLNDKDLELVLLVAWEGLDLAEAAQVVGCSRHTAAMRMHRARKRLERHLDPESPHPAARYRESLK